jgi:hypothetical protein
VKTFTGRATLLARFRRSHSSHSEQRCDAAWWIAHGEPIEATKDRLLA